MEYLEGETLADTPRRRARCRSIRRSDTRSRSRRRSTRRIAPASSIATSSPATSCSRRPARSFSTSVWRRAARRRCRATGSSRCLRLRQISRLHGTILGTVSVHGAGAVRRQSRRCTYRYLRVWRGALRDAVGGQGVRGKQSLEREGRDPRAGAFAACRAAPDGRSHHAHLPREGSGRSLADRSRPAPRIEMGRRRPA